MSLFQQIRADQITARKNKSLSASVLTTLLGEAGTIGKNAGNREPTDDEVMQVVKKFIKNINETVDILSKEHFANAERIGDLTDEKNVLLKYLPTQLSADQLDDAIKTIKVEMKTDNVGLIMKSLQSRYGGLFDGRVASQRIRELA